MLRHATKLFSSYESVFNFFATFWAGTEKKISNETAQKFHFSDDETKETVYKISYDYRKIIFENNEDSSYNLPFT